MESFWKGAFAKAACDHGNTMVSIGIPENGAAPVYVQFNHTCSGRVAPSNSTVYTFEIELDEFTDGEQDAAKDLQTELDNMNDSDKINWVNDNLLAGETIDIRPSFW